MLSGISHCSDNVVQTVNSKNISSRARRYALILHQMLIKTGLEMNPSTEMKAILLVAQRETFSKKLAPENYDDDAVAMEIFIVQFQKEKIILPESCLRIHLNQLCTFSPLCKANAEEVVKVALLLLHYAYTCDACLFPDSSALASLIASCEIIGIDDFSINMSDTVTKIKNDLVSFASTSL